MRDALPAAVAALAGPCAPQPRLRHVAVAALLVYWNSHEGKFVLDDLPVCHSARRVSAGDGCWGGKYHQITWECGAKGRRARASD